MVKGILSLIIYFQASLVLAFPYFEYATESSAEYNGIQDGANIKLSLQSKDESFQRILSELINGYLQTKSVKIDNAADLSLDIVCGNDAINEPFEFTQVLPVASIANQYGPSHSIFQTQQIKGMRTVDALKCNGTVRSHIDLWHFIIRIPKAFISDFEKNGMKYAARLFEYEGTGYVNLETGEVY